MTEEKQDNTAVAAPVEEKREARSEPPRNKRDFGRRRPRHGQNNNNPNGMPSQNPKQAIALEINQDIPAIDISALKHLKIDALHQILEQEAISTDTLLRKQDMVFAILKNQA